MRWQSSTRRTDMYIMWKLHRYRIFKNEHFTTDYYSQARRNMILRRNLPTYVIWGALSLSHHVTGPSYRDLHVLTVHILFLRPGSSRVRKSVT